MDLIRFADKGISRADLADKMGLTRAAVTVIINDLIYYGVQSGIIVLASLFAYTSTEVNGENLVAFLNLLIAIFITC